MIDLADLIINKDAKTSRKSSVVNGVMLGIVKSNWDEAFPGCVEVEMHYGAEGKTKTEWIRVMQPYAGKEFGQFFHPEIGTEVVVSYILGNLNSPIVIGSLWNADNPLPKESANEDNTIKKIVTKGGHEIVFDDKADDESITIQTKGKMTIKITDKDQKIAVGDEKGKNGIVIDAKSGAVDITADKKITLKAGSESIELAGTSAITIKGTKVEAKASMDLNLEGTNVKVDAKAQCGLKGGATAKLEGGGMTEIKGAMVKIN